MVSCRSSNSRSSVSVALLYLFYLLVNFAHPLLGIAELLDCVPCLPAYRVQTHLDPCPGTATQVPAPRATPKVPGVYSILPAAGPTAVACLVLGSMPISATPPTPPRLAVTTWPRALRLACTSSGRVLGIERLPRLARSWPKELMKCVVEKRGALNASSGLMPNST